MEEYISRQEHETFAELMRSENKRLSDEDNRQNKRIDSLENQMREVSNLTVSIEKLATNMEAMLKEQKLQGKRLEVLENRDGEKWRKLVWYVITLFVGAIFGFVFHQIGLS